MQNIQVLKITKTKEIFFSAVLTALAVYAPMLVHSFGGVNAGRKFLPMPFFVLLAGLALGWRAGLVTGLASPAISFLLSGMPRAEILPFVIVQLCVYGLVAGLLNRKYNASISIALAILAGLFSITISMLLFSKMNAFVYAAGVIKDGWIGMLVQIILISLVIKLVEVRPLQRES